MKNDVILPKYIRDHKRSQGLGRGGSCPPAIELLPMTKICDKKAYCFFSFFCHFLRTTAINNNIEDQGARAPSTQFLPTNLNALPGKFKGFCSKSCNLRPSCNVFMNVMQQPGPDFSYGTVPLGPRAQRVSIFWVFTYIWQEDVAKIPKVTEASQSVNPARTITWLVGVTTYCTSIFQQQSTSTSPVFTRQNTVGKKLARGNAH